ncbi:MAG: adenylate/guanylate cyclase domain-containing protein [Acidimicrobiia bacterium]
MLRPSASFEAQAARVGTGVEPPAEVASRRSLPYVLRSFGFVDLSGFTLFTEEQGPHAATAELAGFREIVRQVAAARGVRVAKWLGDGAMLVGLEFGPMMATCVELAARCCQSPVPMRAGAALGAVLLFEGDDYVGPAVNLAARLCDIGEHSEVLVANLATDETPDWIASSQPYEIEIRGIGRVEICRLQMNDDVELPPLTL